MKYGGYDNNWCIFIKIIFSDELRTVKDRKYGMENHEVKGGWDGMVGEIIRKVWTIELIKRLLKCFITIAIKIIT